MTDEEREKIYQQIGAYVLRDYELKIARFIDKQITEGEAVTQPTG